MIAGGSYADAFGPAALPASSWSYLAETYDGSTLRLYVNGTEVASTAHTGTIANSANPLQIGGDSIYGQFFDGLIDEVRVYNVALTAAQIQTDQATPVNNGPDTTAPTQPGTLTASAVSGGEVDLSWGASTDNVGVTGYLVERCQGAGCSSFTQIATATGTSYKDTGLSASTSYSYRVRGTDAAGNLSPYSNTASATTSASATQGLVAAFGFDEGSGRTVTDASGNGNTGTIADATWVASGKYGKALQFNGTSALVTVPDAASLHLSGGMTLEAWVNPSAVSADWRDVIYKGNDNFYLSATSTEASSPDAGMIAGGSYADAFGPAALPASSWSYLAETYDGSTLRLYVNGTEVASTAHTGTIANSANPLQIGGDSIYGQFFDGLIDEVRVYNVALTAAQIQTDQATPVNNGPDTTAPTQPGTLTASAVSGGEVDLSWGASTDNVGVTGYLVERCQGAGCSSFTQIATATGTSYKDTGLSASTSYSYRVRGTDAAGNLSPYSNTASATTSASATQGLVAAFGFDEGSGRTVTDASGNGNTGTIADATWVASGKYGKALQFNGTSALVTVPDAASLHLSGGMTLEAWVNPSAVSADWRDVIYKGNDNFYLSATSTEASSPDAGMIAGGSYADAFGPAALPASSWSYLAETYDGSTLRLYVNGTEVASTAHTGTIANSANPLQIGGDSIYGQFFDGLIDEVRVYNVALTAAQIQTDQATPVNNGPDTTAPTQPGTLTASAVSGGEVDLSWGASTDNVGVTGYLVERCQGAGCSSFTQIATATGTSYKDTGLSASTSYSYRVRGTDAAGNLSPYSNTASATTSASATQGLVAAFGFDEGSGRTVTDASGNGNTGTIADATWVASGKYGKALQFNGTSALVTVPDAASLHLSGGMTLEAWVNPSAVSADWRDVIYKGNDNFYLSATSTEASSPDAGMIAGGSYADAFGPAALPASSWSYLAETYDGSTLRLYVNGTEVASTAHTGTIANSANPLQIGGDSIYGQFFDGLIDEVRVYNVALTAAQIQTDQATPVNNGPDTTAPTQPGTLTASAVSGGEVDLSWGASTDNVGVTGYLVERCQGAGCSSFTQIATATGTSYKDTGLSASTSYSYRVRGTDAAGNLSPYSNTASATTSASATQGLVAAFGFDEGSGRTVTDASGNGNTGTIADATWVASGKYGKALQFNGTSALVTVPDAASLHLSGGTTLEAWVNPSAVSADWRDVIYKGNDNFYLSATSTEASSPDAGIIAGGSYADAFGPAALPASSWSYLAETYDGSTLRLYVNGTEVASTAHTGTIANSANPLQIGGDSIYGQFFDGLIDEVRVYNVALTAAQIQTDQATPVNNGPDTTAPTQPGTLTASAVSGGEVDLSWGASTDNVGVTGYLVERCQGAGCSSFTQIATATGTSYKDTGLSASTSYSYRVRATD